MTMPTTLDDLRDRAGPSGRFDVVIAGAGLAGGSLALRLSRSGLRVALLDPGRFPRDKLCGEFLSPECWGAFERLGFGPALAGLGYHPIERVRITTPRGRSLSAAFLGEDGRPGIGLSRSALDDRLAREARAAGAAVVEGVRVSGPVVREGRVVGVAARDGAAGPVEVLGAVTVAADGRGSALVRRTGRTRARSRFRPRLFGLKRHLDVADRDAEPAGTVGLHLVPGGYVGACRVETGQTNLCGLLPESTLRRHRGDLDALAAAAFPSNPVLGRLWDASTPAGAWKTVAGVRVESSTPDLAGILYAGDCRGTVDPLGGQGMTMALLGAEALAPFILRAVAEGVAGPALQAEATAAWHRRFDRRVNLCRFFHHVLINPAVIDLGSVFATLAPKLLALGFRQTRDSVPV